MIKQCFNCCLFFLLGILAYSSMQEGGYARYILRKTRAAFFPLNLAEYQALAQATTLYKEDPLTKELSLTLVTDSSYLDSNAEETSAITYGLSGGRFGDNLLTLCHAKWISYSLGIPLLYKPFPYSDQLALSTNESILRGDKKFKEHRLLYRTPDYLNLLQQLNESDSVLYEVPYYPESPCEYDTIANLPLLNLVDWEDPEFVREIRKLISPLKPIQAPKLPEDRLTVAMHIRTGINHDGAGWNLGLPLKGPPESYYIDALNYLYLTLGQPLYVFIFTDHPNPPEVRDRFRTTFGNCQIDFDCRTSENRQDLNVLDDFFAMEKFDCLIRSESNFSLMAAKLFKYLAVISPNHFLRSGNQITIDRFLLQIGPYKNIQKPFKIILRKT